MNTYTAYYINPTSGARITTKDVTAPDMMMAIQQLISSGVYPIDILSIKMKMVTDSVVGV